MSGSHAPQEISDTERASSSASRNFVARTDYDKLYLSFLSGLINEQDLALSVSTILSNEGSYMLHLERTPKLVNLLVAQAGVWPEGDAALKEIYLQNWEGVKGRNMQRFWRATVDWKNMKHQELCDWNVGDLDEDDDTDMILNLELDLGSLNLEGQRVLRVALILHNLSFEKNNVPVLVSNTNFLRFVLLCMHSTWADLRQTAYDTIANLASEIQLTIQKGLVPRLLFQTVMDGIRSSDRYLVIRSLDILSQLCSCESNEDIIPSKLDAEIYQRMISCLTVQDIMLLFFTLEALYALSDLGRYACDKIVNVHRSIGALMSLLTLEPKQYGPSSQIRMKIVEKSVPADSDSEHREVSCTVSISSQPPVATPIVPTIAAPISTCAITPILINSVTTSTAVAANDGSEAVRNWLKANYEYSSGCSVPKTEVYAEYVSNCSKQGKKGYVDADTFATSVMSVFSSCNEKKIDFYGVTSLHYDGLRKKRTSGCSTKVVNGYTTPVKKVNATASSPVVSGSKVNQKPTHSPILKAQLSAPPRPLSPTVNRNVNPSTAVQKTAPASMACQVPPNKSPIVQSNTTPASSGMLIKSLLANKVQQRSLQHQLHVQPNLTKMVIYSPDKTVCLNRNTGATQTVLRAVRPGGLSVTRQFIPARFARAPLQGRFITNKGRVAATASPLILPKLQTKIVKAVVTSTASPVSRFNGMNHSTQIETSLQPKKFERVGGYQTIHTRPVQSIAIPDSTSIDSNDSICSDSGSFKESCFSSDSERNSVLSHEDSQSGGIQVSASNSLSESPVVSMSNSTSASDFRKEGTESMQSSELVSSLPSALQGSDSKVSAVLSAPQCSVSSSASAGVVFATSPPNSKYTSNECKGVIQETVSSVHNISLSSALGHNTSVPVISSVSLGNMNSLSTPNSASSVSAGSSAVLSLLNSTSISDSGREDGVLSACNPILSMTSSAQNVAVSSTPSTSMSSITNSPVLVSSCLSSNSTVVSASYSCKEEMVKAVSSVPSTSYSLAPSVPFDSVICNSADALFSSSASSSPAVSVSDSLGVGGELAASLAHSTLVSTAGSVLLGSVSSSNASNSVLNFPVLSSSISGSPVVSLSAGIPTSYLCKENTKNSATFPSPSQSSLISSVSSSSLTANIPAQLSSMSDTSVVSQPSSALINELTQNSGATLSLQSTVFSPAPSVHVKSVNSPNLLLNRSSELPLVSVSSSNVPLLNVMKDDMDVGISNLSVISDSSLSAIIKDEMECESNSSAVCASSNLFSTNTAKQEVGQDVQCVSSSQGMSFPVGSLPSADDAPVSSASFVPQNATTPSKSADLLKTVFDEVFSDLEFINEDTAITQTDREKICKAAPLLNGLLDRGKAPLLKDPQTFAVVQNEIKKDNVMNEVSSEKPLDGGNVANVDQAVSSTAATNNDSIIQLCTGHTTISGTIEAQRDQNGVVRLHIESPENSNQGCDLSSISDIAQTLECASKEISRTNAECGSQVPFTCACGTAATVSVVTTNAAAVANTGQQVIFFTPALNQPQLYIQSPNIKFCILQSVPKVEETVDLVSLPRVSVSQVSRLQQPIVSTAPSTVTLKRPSTSDSQSSLPSPVAKKPCMDSKAILTNTVSSKQFQGSRPLLPKVSSPQVIEPCSPVRPPAPRVTVAAPTQSAAPSCEKEVKTFSGLATAGSRVSAVPATVSEPTKPSPELEYVCEWKNCCMKFPSPGAVLVHAGKVHAPYSTEDMICQWEGCDSMKRRRFSLLTHLQDWHCNEKVLRAQAVRRKQLDQQGKTTIAAPQMPPPHPGYAPDAAILAIRRHALQYLNPKELSEEKESALAKSIRLTSALILRNLATYSSLARSHLRSYEPELAYLAMSPVESSRTIAQCLSELSRDT